MALNFKGDWKHVQCGRIRWGPGSRPIVAKWAQEQLDSGLHEPSKSHSASRPHAVKKPPPGSPKDVDITKCGMRTCGDYRKPNEQLKKPVSTLPLGPEELAKLGGYDTYWVTDHYGMYHAYVLAPGPSRELLAIDTPIGIIQPTRLIEGEKNAGQVASTPIRTKILSLPDNAGDRTACFVDDQAQGNNFVESDDPLVRYGNLLKGWRDYLQMCRENNFTLNPSKTKLGFPSATFYGFEASKKGFTLADKNLDPIRKMVPPANLSELRHVLGVFVQSKNYFPDEHPYAQTAKPLTALTGGKKGNPVPFIWTETHQKAFDTVRDLLLSGLHLAAPDFRLPFHAGGDASEDGKSFGLWQFYDDKVASGKFKVVDHGPDHTTVLFDGETKPYSIPHSLDNRRQIHNFSKCWENDAQSTRAPYYIELDASFWGLKLTRFWSSSSMFPLYVTSDHQPLKWVQHSQKGAVSARIIEEFSDIDWVLTYVPGPDNLQDSNSRCPMLGPRRLAPAGFTHTLDDLLTRLPERFKTVETIQVHADKYTQEAARQVQRWRTATNPILQHSVSFKHPPRSQHLVISTPPPVDAPRVAAHLLLGTVPFAVLLPSDLGPTIASKNLLGDGREISDKQYNSLGKIAYLSTDKLWVIGNIPELSPLREIYYNDFETPAPLSIYANTATDDDDVDIPTTIEEWIQEQEKESALSDQYPENETSNLDGLLIKKDPHFSTLIIVPTSLREPLTRQHHAQLHHLSHVKVHSSLSRHYTWPGMRSDIRKWLEEYQCCELEKARRRQAHGMFSARPSSGPRSRYCMDYQGQGKANTGEVECMGIIDSFSKWVDFYPLHDRAAETLAPILLDQVHFKHGPPDILHSDEAQTYMSKLLQALYDRLGCHRTTNLGHHAEGNAEIEVMWRFWNRCMRILPPSHYQKWPLFASQIAWAHNTTPQDSLGNVSPFEIQYGTLPRSPFDSDPNFKPDSQLPTRDLGDPDEYATAVRESAAAFKELATRHQEHVRKDTARRLNKQGTSTNFELGDRVKIYVPPTAADIERTGRPGKHIVSWRGPCTINEKISATAH